MEAGPVDAYVRQHAPAVMSCFRGRADLLRGKPLSFMLLVKPDGRVLESIVSGATEGLEWTFDCVRNTARMWTLPAKAPGYSVTCPIAAP